MNNPKRMTRMEINKVMRKIRLVAGALALSIVTLCARPTRAYFINKVNSEIVEVFQTGVLELSTSEPTSIGNHSRYTDTRNFEWDITNIGTLPANVTVTIKEEGSDKYINKEFNSRQGWDKVSNNEFRSTEELASGEYITFPLALYIDTWEEINDYVISISVLGEQVKYGR